MYVGRKEVIHTFRAGPGIKCQGYLHGAGLSYGGGGEGKLAIEHNENCNAGGDSLVHI